MNSTNKIYNECCKWIQYILITEYDLDRTEALKSIKSFGLRHFFEDDICRFLNISNKKWAETIYMHRNKKKREMLNDCKN